MLDFAVKKNTVLMDVLFHSTGGRIVGREDRSLPRIFTPGRMTLWLPAGRGSVQFTCPEVA